MQPTLTQWYRNMKMPNWGNPLIEWLRPSAGLLSTMLPYNVPIRFSPSTETAFADREGHCIVVGTSFLEPIESARLNPYATQSEAITFGLGAIVHEAAHFAWSPNTIQDLLNHGIANTEVNGFIANIVEDIYIEHRVVTQFPKLAWMIGGAWDYVFDKRLACNSEAWDGLSLDSASVVTICNTFVGWKHQDRVFIPRSVVESEFLDLFYSVRGMNSLRQRKDLIEKIIEKLQQHTTTEEEKEGDDGSAPESYSPSNKPVTKEMKRSTFKVDALERPDHFLEKKNAQSVVGVEGVVNDMVVVGSCGESTILVSYDRRWERFADVAKQRGAVRTVSGPASMSGRRLNHPANIIDNGKVFSNSTLQSTSGRVATGFPEFIFLVDFSSSMSGEKFANAKSALYGAAKGLIDVGIKFAIYGYTTSSKSGGETTWMTKVKGLEESGLVALKRIAWLNDRLIDMDCTPDTPALMFAEKQFSNNGSDKVLIVISDGTPNRGLSDSTFATKSDEALANVARIRKNGIHVFGLSVDKSSDGHVRRIYGEDHSICSSDANSIEVFLKKFV